MVRLALCTLLLVAGPACAAEPGAALDAAMRCVLAAMTDPLVPVSAMREQIAASAIARCYDEIEVAAAAAAGSSAPVARIDAARTALRRELQAYALQSAWAGSWTDASHAERETGVLRAQLRD
jgi:hypothetical protein